MGSDYSVVDVDGYVNINGIDVPFYLSEGSHFRGHRVYLNWEEWDREAKTARTLTDPYGVLGWAVGGGDNFYCFDYAQLPDGRVILDAVINSETGGFIMSGGYEVCWPEDAVDTAIGMIDQAIDWCYDCGEPYIRHHQRGWNQDEYYWVRCVARRVGDPRLGRLRARIIRPPRNRSSWLFDRKQLPHGWHIKRLHNPEAICMERDADNYITEPISWQGGDNVFQLARKYLERYNWFQEGIPCPVKRKKKKLNR